MSPDNHPGISSWLGFELAGQHYGVSLADVREILRHEPPTQVPGAPADVLGIISLRGSIVTILDGCTRLGLHTPAAGPDQRLLIFHDDAETIGMRIDALQEVLDLDTRELMPPPPGRATRADDPVLGTLYRDGGFIALLDTRKLCRVPSTGAGGST